MAIIHKISFYIADVNDEWSSSDIDCVLSNKFNAEFVKVESSDEFEWDDDLEINKVDNTKEDFDKYFN